MLRFPVWRGDPCCDGVAPYRSMLGRMIWVQGASDPARRWINIDIDDKVR
jgi:hypothetical protein